jgi:oxaloacetate decarboxylase (Na+ extruding) subunit gamma
MLFEGVKLMIVGMTTVMLFLSLMILFINLSAFLTKGQVAKEMERMETERKLAALKRKQAREAASGGLDEDIAVITAAVAAYEAERFAQA